MASSPSLLSPLSTFKSIHPYPIQPLKTRFIAKTWHTSTPTKPIIFRINNSSTPKNSRTETKSSDQNETIECIGNVNMSENMNLLEEEEENLGNGLLSVGELWEWVVLISPFFFWGTAMVAMKEVIPKVGPLAVASFRLIPAGMLLIGFAGYKGRPMPSGFIAWLSISLFALVDATSFQGFLAEGLQKTAAGLGSVIIDSQPLTVAILAALFFGESIGYVGAAGLVLGVVGLLLLELPAIGNNESEFSLWGSGEWLMLLSAQSMAIGTVMVRWVSKYSDPIMATGWHMLLGGLPLTVLSLLNNDPVFSGGLKELSSGDYSALFYTSIFGSAISYGVFFYNATKGSLTKLSSLTFLTPMFASIFGFVYLGESFSNVQLVGAFITLVAIYLVNYRSKAEA